MITLTTVRLTLPIELTLPIQLMVSPGEGALSERFRVSFPEDTPPPPHSDAADHSGGTTEMTKNGGGQVTQKPVHVALTEWFNHEREKGRTEFSQSAFAKMIKVSVGDISNYLHGKKRLGTPAIQRIAEQLGISVETFLAGPDAAPAGNNLPTYDIAAAICERCDGKNLAVSTCSVCRLHEFQVASRHAENGLPVPEAVDLAETCYTKHLSGINRKYDIEHGFIKPEKD